MREALGCIGSFFTGIIALVCLTAFAAGVLALHENALRDLDAQNGAILRGPTIHDVDPAHDGAVIELIGPASDLEPLADPELGVRATALALERKIEVYEDIVDPAEASATIMGWSDRGALYGGGRADNPRWSSLRSQRWSPPTLRVGAYSIEEADLDLLDREPLPLVEGEFTMPAALDDGRGLTLVGGALVSGSPGAPAPGDLRISLQRVLPTERLSIYGKLTGAKMSTWTDGYGVDKRPRVTHAPPSSPGDADASRERLLVLWGPRAFAWLLIMCGLASPLSGLNELISRYRRARSKDNSFGCVLFLICGVLAGPITWGIWKLLTLYAI